MESLQTETGIRNDREENISTNQGIKTAVPINIDDCTKDLNIVEQKNNTTESPKTETGDNDKEEHNKTTNDVKTNGPINTSSYTKVVDSVDEHNKTMESNLVETEKHSEEHKPTNQEVKTSVPTSICDYTKNIDSVKQTDEPIEPTQIETENDNNEDHNKATENVKNISEYTKDNINSVNQHNTITNPHQIEIEKLKEEHNPNNHEVKTAVPVKIGHYTKDKGCIDQLNKTIEPPQIEIGKHDREEHNKTTKDVNISVLTNISEYTKVIEHSKIKAPYHIQTGTHNEKHNPTIQEVKTAVPIHTSGYTKYIGSGEYQNKIIEPPHIHIETGNNNKGEPNQTTQGVKNTIPVKISKYNKDIGVHSVDQQNKTLEEHHTIGMKVTNKEEHNKMTQNVKTAVPVGIGDYTNNMKSIDQHNEAMVQIDIEKTNIGRNPNNLINVVGDYTNNMKSIDEESNVMEPFQMETGKHNEEELIPTTQDVKTDEPTNMDNYSKDINNVEEPETMEPLMGKIGKHNEEEASKDVKTIVPMKIGEYDDVTENIAIAKNIGDCDDDLDSFDTHNKTLEQGHIEMDTGNKDVHSQTPQNVKNDILLNNDDSTNNIKTIDQNNEAIDQIETKRLNNEHNPTNQEVNVTAPLNIGDYTNNMKNIDEESKPTESFYIETGTHKEEVHILTNQDVKTAVPTNIGNYSKDINSERQIEVGKHNEEEHHKPPKDVKTVVPMKIGEYTKDMESDDHTIPGSYRSNQADVVKKQVAELLEESSDLKEEYYKNNSNSKATHRKSCRFNLGEEVNSHNRMTHPKVMTLPPKTQYSKLCREDSNIEKMREAARKHEAAGKHMSYGSQNESFSNAHHFHELPLDLDRTIDTLLSMDDDNYKSLYTLDLDRTIDSLLSMDDDNYKSKLSRNKYSSAEKKERVFSERMVFPKVRHTDYYMYPARGNTIKSSVCEKIKCEENRKVESRTYAFEEKPRRTIRMAFGKRIDDVEKKSDCYTFVNEKPHQSFGRGKKHFPVDTIISMCEEKPKSRVFGKRRILENKWVDNITHGRLTAAEYQTLRKKSLTNNKYVNNVSYRRQKSDLQHLYTTTNPITPTHQPEKPKCNVYGKRQIAQRRFIDNITPSKVAEQPQRVFRGKKHFDTEKPLNYNENHESSAIGKFVHGSNSNNTTLISRSKPEVTTIQDGRSSEIKRTSNITKRQLRRPSKRQFFSEDQKSNNVIGLGTPQPPTMSKNRKKDNNVLGWIDSEIKTNHKCAGVVVDNIMAHYGDAGDYVRHEATATNKKNCNHSNGDVRLPIEYTNQVCQPMRQRNSQIQETKDRVFPDVKIVPNARKPTSSQMMDMTSYQREVALEKMSTQM